MAKMRMLQPKCKKMRERFGDDRQRMEPRNDETEAAHQKRSTFCLCEKSR